MSNNNLLQNSVQYIKSVGPKRAESFKKIGIQSIRDLLFYFPYKHLDRSTILKTPEVVNYARNGFEGEVTILGKVIESELIRYGKKQLLKVQFKDSQGYFECVWFQGIKFFKDVFHEGDTFAISAKPVLTRYGHLQFTHPDFDKISKEETDEFINTGKIIPYYTLPKALKDKNIGDLSIRRIIRNAVENYSDLLTDTLPSEILLENSLLSLNDAVKTIHFPNSLDDLEKAFFRFKYEELFYIELLVALRKHKIKDRQKGISFIAHKEPLKEFLDNLPFELTEDQLSVLHEIRIDMESQKPMNRLLQGDVGSGKTIVALISMLISVSNGHQAVLMVPTEILADQHFKNISKLLSFNKNYNVSVLIGGQKKKERDIILQQIAEGTSQIVIGTHALFEDQIEFNKLGLVIIDEQHRFGVAQRAKLIDKGITPDVLVMTATPIPRTLSMTVYGDLDVSVILHKPKNRKDIKTYVRSENKLPEIYNFIKTKINEGQQAFIVYPLVEESEKLDLKSVLEEYEALQSTYFKEIKVGLIHGKMKWQQKEEVMLDFASKKYDVLFSTTVIEVGIDIPNANIIVINDAFRFGLSQLHQLRGRVGRGNEQAYCILIAKEGMAVKSNRLSFNFDYLSKQQIEKNKAAIRLNSMVKYTSGFDLSEIDLKLRGPGDLFGTKQSGLPELRFVDITQDSDIILKAKHDAFNLVNEDPSLNNGNNKIIKQNLLNNYKENLQFYNIA